eukprot:CAMPEP_0198141788 /NCGR_PEP_ID=MMETSP1443-20131203/4728_1 /TAXON_ID=186043 /ORGANISM="Entomoneis sp., Strain CCMP2396" /LENGTH=62 /DNA_ID=CAMNT_0043804627 /DNA_START=94 /DNA_END=282 /DNA_ORIENTATION=+
MAISYSSAWQSELESHMSCPATLPLRLEKALMILVKFTCCSGPISTTKPQSIKFIEILPDLD